MALSSNLVVILLMLVLDFLSARNLAHMFRCCTVNLARSPGGCLLHAVIPAWLLWSLLLSVFKIAQPSLPSLSSLFRRACLHLQFSCPCFQLEHLVSPLILPYPVLQSANTRLFPLPVAWCLSRLVFYLLDNFFVSVTIWTCINNALHYNRQCICQHSCHYGNHDNWT